MDNPTSEESIERLLQLSDRVFRELLPIVPQQLLEMDLTMPQLKVVLLLFLNGSMRMSALASSLGVTLATATGIIDRLVEHSLVIRQSSPDDRRVVLCQLSDKGQKLTGGLWQTARQRARRLLEAVDPSRLKLIGQALEALSEAGVMAKKEDNQPPQP
ncbi:MAG: MarR family transcriptional regulator [Dehalococcoidales bacterium]|nr:MarR family transcriptional regulator [Dehalococcoidales bacterium]